jgi:exodeoxyribonuclease VII large subunit
MLADRAGRVQGGVLRLMERRRTELRAAMRALPDADAILALPRQRTDAAGARLAPSLKTGLDQRRLGLAALSRRLAAQSPHARIGRIAERLDALGGRLSRGLQQGQARQAERFAVLSARLMQAFASRTTLERQTLLRQRERLDIANRRLPAALAALSAARRERLAGRARLLGSFGHRAVLARGFALVRDETGHMLHSAHVAAGTALSIEFEDGKLSAVAGTGERRPSQRTKPKDSGGQTSLF